MYQCTHLQTTNFAINNKKLLCISNLFSFLNEYLQSIIHDVVICMFYVDPEIADDNSFFRIKKKN